VLITEIYPARELPIEGVTSEIIFNELRGDMQKQCCQKSELPQIVAARDFDVLVVLGAGDVENYMKQFKELLEQKIK
jgi:UDP-N-acetylmuramate--alanine ligase